MIHSLDSKDVKHSRMAVRKRTAQLLNLWRPEPEDETDRVPSTLRVTEFDLFCYVFATFTYILDIGLDLVVAYFYYSAGRTSAALLTLFFVLGPSIILNVISLIWWIDDLINRNYINNFNSNIKLKVFEKESSVKSFKSKKEIEVYSNETESENSVDTKTNTITLWIVATICQFGPILWYWKAINRAWLCFKLQKRPRRERLLYAQIYIEKIEGDRDAAVLRFFEACLEAMPQVLLQSYFLTLDWQNYGFTGKEFQWQWRAMSMCLSLISISYSFVAHHRVLRVSLPHKQNLKPLECNLIFFWRLFTVSARLISLTLLIFTDIQMTVIVSACHVILTVIHLRVLQKVESGTTVNFLDRIFFCINVWIHIFAPFNMSEGKSRIRYSVGYGMELIEACVTVTLLITIYSQRFLYQEHLCALMGVAYLIGILVMIAYHWRIHPQQLKRLDLRETSQSQSQKFVPIQVQEPGNFVCDFKS